MATRCSRFFINSYRTSISCMKSSINRPSSASAARPAAPLPRSTSSPLPSPTFNFTRIPSELGCVQSLLPLHSAVAASRMTSCLSTMTTSRALLQGT